MSAYRAVLSVRDARRVLLLGLVVRTPLFAAGVVLVLHVVSHLHHSYGAAGFLVGVETVALAVSAPWRGRRLDQVGLRSAVAPSLVILAACWTFAPFVSYWPLLILVAVANLFTVPTFTIVRQALMHNAPESQRTSALSIDSVVTELAFMTGPPLGVVLATSWSTPWALFVCEFASIGGGLLLWVVNPRLRSVDADADAAAGERVRARRWLTPAVLGVLAASLATTIVLTGTDVGIVAALRHMGHPALIGLELAVWGLGSGVGGLLYGALHRTLPAVALLSLLAVTTIPVGLAREAFTLGVLLFVTGFFCAPTITATVDSLSRMVPERVRGEALGWHGSALTAGGALGAPIAGVAVDHWGWRAAFVVTGVIGLAAAAVLFGVRSNRARVAEPELAASSPLS